MSVWQGAAPPDGILSVGRTGSAAPEVEGLKPLQAPHRADPNAHAGPRRPGASRPARAPSGLVQQPEGAGHRCVRASTAVGEEPASAGRPPGRGVEQMLDRLDRHPVHAPDPRIVEEVADRREVGGGGRAGRERAGVVVTFTGRPLRRVIPSAPRSTVKYDDDWLALEKLRIWLSTDTDISQVARLRHRSGSAFHALNTSTAPIVPAVVTRTSVVVDASSRVTIPNG